MYVRTTLSAFSQGNQCQPSFRCLSSFSRARYFFSCHQQWAAPSLLLFLPVCSYPTLRSVLLSRHWVCLSSLPPYVHTLLNNLRSENAIIECLSIQLDHRDMLFLPISFAPFRWLNNVCVSSTSTLLDVGGCRWESSVCQVCHQDDTIQWQIADFRQISPWNACRENEIGWDRELVQVSDFIPFLLTPLPNCIFILSPELVVIALCFLKKFY